MSSFLSGAMAVQVLFRKGDYNEYDSWTVAETNAAFQRLSSHPSYVYANKEAAYKRAKEIGWEIAKGRRAPIQIINERELVVFLCWPGQEVVIEETVEEITDDLRRFALVMKG